MKTPVWFLIFGFVGFALQASIDPTSTAGTQPTITATSPTVRPSVVQVISTDPGIAEAHRLLKLMKEAVIRDSSRLDITSNQACQDVISGCTMVDEKGVMDCYEIMMQCWYKTKPNFRGINRSPQEIAAIDASASAAWTYSCSARAMTPLTTEILGLFYDNLQHTYCTEIFRNEFQVVVTDYHSAINTTTHAISSDLAVLDSCGIAEPPLQGVMISLATDDLDGQILAEFIEGTVNVCNGTFGLVPVNLMGDCTIEFLEADTSVELCNEDSDPVGFIIKDSGGHLKIKERTHWFSLYNIYLRYFGGVKHEVDFKGSKQQHKITGKLTSKSCRRIKLSDHTHGSHLDVSVKCGSSSRSIKKVVDKSVVCNAKHNSWLMVNLCSHYAIVRLIFIMALLWVFITYLRNNIITNVLEYILYIPSSILTRPVRYAVPERICTICGDVKLIKHECNGPCGFCGRLIKSGYHECDIPRNVNNIHEITKSLKERDGRYKVHGIINPTNDKLAKFWLVVITGLLLSYMIPPALALHLECRPRGYDLVSRSQGTKTFDLGELHHLGVCNASPQKYLYELVFTYCPNYPIVADKAKLQVHNNKADIMEQLEYIYPYHKLLPEAFKNATTVNVINRESKICGDFWKRFMEEGLALTNRTDKLFYGQVVSGIELLEVADEVDKKNNDQNTNKKNVILVTDLEKQIATIFNSGYYDPPKFQATQKWNLDVPQSDGSHVLDIDLNAAYGESFSYQLVTGDGSQPFVVNGHVGAAFYEIKLNKVYKTCSPGDINTKSTWRCWDNCDTCLQYLREAYDDFKNFPDAYITKVWPNANNWACEGQGCWGINEGCVCAACSNWPGTDCSTVYEITGVTPMAELCLTVNGKGGCKILGDSQGIVKSEIQIVPRFTLTNSEVLPGKLIAFDETSSTYMYGQIAQKGVISKSFGNPQYGEDNSLILKSGDGDLESECHGQKPWVVNVKTCWDNTYHMKSDLKAIGIKAYGKEKLKIDTPVGSIKLALRVKQGTYKWAEDDIVIKTSIQKVDTCVSCGIPDSILAVFSSSRATNVHLSCKGFSPIMPIVYVKQGSTTLNISGVLTTGDIKCQVLGQNSKVLADAGAAISMIEYRHSAGYNETKNSIVVKSQSVSSSTPFSLPDFLKFSWLSSIGHGAYNILTNFKTVMYLLIAIVVAWITFQASNLYKLYKVKQQYIKLKDI